MEWMYNMNFHLLYKDACRILNEMPQKIVPAMHTLTLVLMSATIGALYTRKLSVSKWQDVHL